MDTTDISLLVDDLSTSNEKSLDGKSENELCEIFFNGDESINIRINALEKLKDINQELCRESVDKVASMFMFAPTDIFRQLLKSIIFNSKLDINIKNECAQQLY